MEPARPVYKENTGLRVEIESENPPWGKKVERREIDAVAIGVHGRAGKISVWALIDYFLMVVPDSIHWARQAGLFQSATWAL